MTYGYITCKWPALVVRGSTLTREQTNEVIVRMTASPWMLSGNDDEWRTQIHELFGVTADPWHDGPSFWHQNTRVEEEFHFVPTEYLTLSGRIYSAMIGGAYGWCDWDGRINSVYNIGKWPSIAELDEQWSAVARAFPFLSLTAQVLDDEASEIGDDTALAGEWTVSGGRAVFSHRPGERIDVDKSTHTTDRWDAWFANEHRERHVDFNRLQEAVAQVREGITTSGDARDD